MLDRAPSPGRPSQIPKIVLRRFCGSLGPAVTDIENVVKECYHRLGPHNVELLDLLLFEDMRQMNSFYASEKEASRVVSETVSERFFAVHDAWKGTPRIGICLENMARVPEQVRIGVLRHEVGHSILHGSVEHYVFPVPPILLETERKFGLRREYSLSLLYLISIAVKDFEVTKLLVDKGYVEDQLAYSLHVLPSSDEDLAAWKMAEGNLLATALCLAGRLKDVACILAIIHILKKPPLETLKAELSYLPKPILDRFFLMAETLPQQVTGETLRSVNNAVRMFVETFLLPHSPIEG